MTTWSKIISEGTLIFPTISSVDKKIFQIECEAEQLLIYISKVCDDKSVEALERAIRLKTKGVDHKSPYEAINQLLHYWHCMIAGKKLLQLGCSDLKITGGAENSGELADVVATAQNGDAILGEVFCVSESLWPSKTLKTIEKIRGEEAEHKFILFNINAKEAYTSKAKKIAFYGVNRTNRNVELLCYSEYGSQTRPELDLSGTY